MPIAAKVTFSGKWSPITALLKSEKLGPAIKREVGRATGLNARKVAAAIRAKIKEGMKPANAVLTLAIKVPSTKPLVNPSKMGGDLFQAITSEVETWDLAFAGVLKNVRGAGGGLVNLGELLHEGATIKVTPAMRNLFRLLANATNPRPRTGESSSGRTPYSGSLAAAKTQAKLSGRARQLFDFNPGCQWKPLRDSTTHIRIPGRPFIREALTDELIGECQKEWGLAVDRALAGVS